MYTVISTASDVMDVSLNSYRLNSYRRTVPLSGAMLIDDGPYPIRPLAPPYRRGSTGTVACRGGHTVSQPLGDEEELAGSAAGFEVVVGDASVVQGVLPAVEFQPARRDVTEDRGGAREQFVAGEDVVGEGRAGQEHRAGGLQPVDVEGLRLAARVTVECQRAARPQGFQAAVERGRADAVVDRGDAFVVGEPPHLGREAVVSQDLVGADLAGQPLLLVGGDGADDPGAAQLG